MQIADLRIENFRGIRNGHIRFGSHTMGMSWTPSLDKAIWYAAHHAEFHDLGDQAVYVAIVPITDIYCRLDHYDDDYIVYPVEAWRIDVPGSEFHLDLDR